MDGYEQSLLGSHGARKVEEILGLERCIINQSNPDRTGWDMLVEKERGLFRFRGAIDATAVKEHYHLQVKTSENGVWKLEKSTLIRAMDSPIPYFFVLLDCDWTGNAEFKSGFLLFMNDTDIKSWLSNNKKSINLTSYGISKRTEGMVVRLPMKDGKILALNNQIERVVGAGHANKAAWKATKKRSNEWGISDIKEEHLIVDVGIKIEQGFIEEIENSLVFGMSKTITTNAELRASTAISKPITTEIDVVVKHNPQRAIMSVNINDHTFLSMTVNVSVDINLEQLGLPSFFVLFDSFNMIFDRNSKNIKIAVKSSHFRDWKLNEALLYMSLESMLECNRIFHFTMDDGQTYEMNYRKKYIEPSEYVATQSDDCFRLLYLLNCAYDAEPKLLNYVSSLISHTSNASRLAKLGFLPGEHGGAAYADANINGRPVPAAVFQTNYFKFSDTMYYLFVVSYKPVDSICKSMTLVFHKVHFSTFSDRKSLVCNLELARNSYVGLGSTLLRDKNSMFTYYS